MSDNECYEVLVACFTVSYVML